jgi:hypothetical protein
MLPFFHAERAPCHESDSKNRVFWPQKAEKLPVSADSGNFPLVYNEMVTTYMTMQ